MTLRADTLAAGQGWSVSDILCSAGPHDRPFEEQHSAVCIAAVMRGRFQYRTTQGAATLVPGALLLGNHQSCFECGHDHTVGDRCLSFMFDPAYFAAILSAIPGVRSEAFHLPRVPPMMSLTRILADVELACIEHDQVWLEQLALDLAGTAAGLNAASTGPETGPTDRDGQRIATALDRIERNPDAPHRIADLAKEAAMSPYHFLRVFTRLTGMTPHQFVLRTRLQKAAVQLRRSTRSVLDIALDAGFADLSTFNHRFRAIMGMTPTVYRGSRARVSQACQPPGSGRPVLRRWLPGPCNPRPPSQCGGVGRRHAQFG
jgi:AraC family transcriptional regulator